MTCKSKGSVQYASIMGWEQGCTSEGVGWVGLATAAYCRYWGRVVGWGWEERECLFQAASKANGRQSNFL